MGLLLTDKARSHEEYQVFSASLVCFYIEIQLHFSSIHQIAPA